MAHGFAVDPRMATSISGTARAIALSSISATASLSGTYGRCAIRSAPELRSSQGNLWVASGWDGQFLKINKQTGQVLGAIGNGNGTGEGQFLEAFRLRDGFPASNIWTGDTARGRITEMIPAKNRK